jgi:hypothetical protein
VVVSLTATEKEVSDSCVKEFEAVWVTPNPTPKILNPSVIETLSLVWSENELLSE